MNDLLDRFPWMVEVEAWTLEPIGTHGHIPGFHLTDYHADQGCDPDDRAQWRLANPALDEEYMREKAWATARKLTPEAGFRTFRVNQMTDPHAGWLGVDGANVWERLRSPFVMAAGAPTWAGLDVSHHHDSTAVVVPAPPRRSCACRGPHLVAGAGPADPVRRGRKPAACLVVAVPRCRAPPMTPVTWRQRRSGSRPKAC